MSLRIGISIVLGVLLYPSRGYATSIIENRMSVCAAYSSNDIPLIFRGEVVDITPSYHESPQPEFAPIPGASRPKAPEMETVRFGIREAFKGESQSPEVRVIARKGAYRVGGEYLVYLEADPKTGALYTDVYIRWQNMSEAESKVSDLQLLRDLSRTDGKGAIVGRFYLGGADMGGGQAPLADTQINVFIKGPVVRDTQSERYGVGQAYLLADVPPGTYNVWAMAPAAGVAISPLTAPLVTVAANRCQEVDWSLRVDSHIRGRVTDVTGTPLAGASVGLFAWGNRESDFARALRFAPISHRVTNTDGAYDFAGINPGDYSVVLHPLPPKIGDAYPPVFYPAFDTPSEAQVLHLKGPETISGIDLVRPAALRPARVDMTVQRADGMGIDGAIVIVTDPEFALQTVATGRTGAEGNLQVQLFAGREYTLTAHTPDPTGQPQETPQCAGPIEFVAEDGMKLTPLVPDKTFRACRSATHPALANY